MSSVAHALALSTSDAFSSDAFFFRYPHCISLKKVDSKIATVLQRLFVVLIYYLYLHLSQKTVYYEKNSFPPVSIADANIFHHGVCSRKTPSR